MFACTVNSDKRCKPAFIRLTWQPKTIVTVVSARTALKDVKLPPSSYIWAFFSFLCILKRNGLHYYNTAYGFFAFAASLSLLLVPPRSQRVPTRKVQCASIVFLFVVVAFAGFEGYTFWKSWHSYRNSRCHPAYFRLHLRNNRIEKKATDIISEKKWRSVRHNMHFVSCLYKLLQRNGERAFSKNERSALLHDSLDLWAYVIWWCQWTGLTRKQQL